MGNTYFVYLLECRGGSIYTGITTDVKRRFSEHRAGKGGHYTRARKAQKLLHIEGHPNRSVASKREVEIKKWSRDQKLKFIASQSPSVRRKVSSSVPSITR